MGSESPFCLLKPLCVGWIKLIYSYLLKSETSWKIWELNLGQEKSGRSILGWLGELAPGCFLSSAKRERHVWKKNYYHVSDLKLFNLNFGYTCLLLTLDNPYIIQLSIVWCTHSTVKNTLWLRFHEKFFLPVPGFELAKFWLMSFSLDFTFLTDVWTSQIKH